MSAFHLRCPFLTVDPGDDAATFFAESDAFGAETYLDAFAFENFAHRVRNILVVAADEPWPISITVTRLPKRRYIWANSRPM